MYGFNFFFKVHLVKNSKKFCHLILELSNGQICYAITIYRFKFLAYGHLEYLFWKILFLENIDIFIKEVMNVLCEYNNFCINC